MKLGDIMGGGTVGEQWGADDRGSDDGGRGIEKGAMRDTVMVDYMNGGYGIARTRKITLSSSPVTK